MPDKQLRQRIVDALDFEPSIDSADIGVAVEDGVVTLTGHVPSFSQRSTAERIVSRVKGVRGIAEQIEVRPAGSFPAADDELAKQILNALKWNTSVPHDKLQVTVTGGAVTLTGDVEWNYQREAALRAVQHLEGVKSVASRVTITPKAEVKDIRHRIEAALQRDAALEAAAIRVAAEGGRVMLTGRVRTWHERQAAERAAWAAPGVTEVRDEIVVTG